MNLSVSAEEERLAPARGRSTLRLLTWQATAESHNRLIQFSISTNTISISIEAY